MPPIKSKKTITRGTITKVVDSKGPNSMGRSGSTLPEVTVTAKRTPVKPLAVKTDTTRASLRNVPMPKIAKDSTKAPEKKMNRLKTAVSDYTSAGRTAANIALSGFKKEVPEMAAKTKVGKALERGMRVLGGTGAAVGFGALTHLGLGPASVVAGQALYNKRDESSKKRGLLNVGKDLNYAPFQLSGPSDTEKKQVRNSTPLGDTQFND